MPRTKHVIQTRARRKKILKAVRGAYSGRHRLFKNAKETYRKSGNYAFADRRRKKREYRTLWIARINAACRQNGMSYSRLMNGIHLLGIQIDRKMLSEIAIHDQAGFKALIDKARAVLKTSKEATAARVTPKL